jgi:hypothetical protein
MYACMCVCVSAAGASSPTPPAALREAAAAQADRHRRGPQHRAHPAGPGLFVCILACLHICTYVGVRAMNQARRLLHSNVHTAASTLCLFLPPTHPLIHTHHLPLPLPLPLPLRLPLSSSFSAVSCLLLIPPTCPPRLLGHRIRAHRSMPTQIQLSPVPARDNSRMYVPVGLTFTHTHTHTCAWKQLIGLIFIFIYALFGLQFFAARSEVFPPTFLSRIPLPPPPRAKIGDSGFREPPNPWGIPGLP